MESDRITMVKSELKTGNLDKALFYLHWGATQGNKELIESRNTLVADYRYKELINYVNGKARTRDKDIYYSQIILTIINNCCSRNIMSGREFSEKLNALMDLVYLCNTYSLIQKKKIRLNKSNYQMMSQSQSRLNSASKLAENDKEIDLFKTLSIDNSNFINSIKLLTSGEVFYNDYLLNSILDKLQAFSSKQLDRLTNDQRSVINLNLMFFEFGLQTKGIDFSF